FAVDSRTGVGKWTFRTKEAVDSAPVVAGKVAFFGCDDGFFYAVRASDGKLLDSVRLGSKLTAAPSVVNGLILIGSEDGVLHALKP
ncbi:MAG: PQQ-binding-like beta-propeller repeat protein, partial [Fimbriimonas sp.]|nr:PQQ-binding-like beta-propeller repeat protein [Fimbriimonas sp.]